VELKEADTPSYSVQVILDGKYETRNDVRDLYDFTGLIRVNIDVKSEDGSYSTVLAEAKLDRTFLGSTSFRNDEKLESYSDAATGAYVMIRWSYEVGQMDKETTRSSFRTLSPAMDTYKVTLIAQIGSVQWSHEVTQSFFLTQNHDMHTEFVTPLNTGNVDHSLLETYREFNNFYEAETDTRDNSVEFPVGRPQLCTTHRVPLTQLGLERPSDASMQRIRNNIDTFSMSGT